MPLKEAHISGASKWDKKKNADGEEKGWTLLRNKDGYFIVGKVMQEDLVGTDENQNNKIIPGDVILSINNLDIRKSYDEIEYGSFIGSQYDENQKISLKLERKLSNKTKKLIKIETVNKENQFNEYFTEIYLDYINVNEKSGTFEAKIQAIYDDVDLGEEYQLTKSYKRFLTQSWGAKEYLQIPTEEELKQLVELSESHIGGEDE